MAEKQLSLPQGHIETMKRQFQIYILKALLLGIVMITAAEYARWAFQNTNRADWIVYAQEIRPYVYRALVPFIGRLLVMIGLPPEQALTIVVVASAIGLLYGILYLLSSFRRS